MAIEQKERGPIGNLFNDFSDALKRALGSKTRRDPPPDADPYAGSPVRNKRGPNDRGAAVALAEPDDE
jgi:hypothetical protein